jgi:16S rRNA (adenine1518-N6/adenine1519-N6)-dimethyltransferase
MINNSRPSPRPRKRFGQNFLKDPTVIDNIITAFNPKISDHVIEIGPGLGALTNPLLPLVEHLDVIEIDRDLGGVLQTQFSENPRFTLHIQDALKFDFSSLKVPVGPSKKFRIIGNLPYNISTPLIFYLLNFSHLIQDMHFMLQKEVVERMIAKPYTDAFGRLSVMVQYHCETHALLSVKPTAFFPKPKVQSEVVRLVPHLALPHIVDSVPLLRHLTTTAFNHRRKTIANALKSYFNAIDLAQLKIDPLRRPETFSVAEYVLMANYAARHNKQPKLLS